MSGAALSSAAQASAAQALHTQAARAHSATLASAAHSPAALPPRDVDPALAIDFICTDTRHMKPRSLFVAIKGDSFDGHRFLPQAAAGGAVAALVQEIPADAPADMTFVVVNDSRAAMGRLAADVRSAFGGIVIGVAGSNGKTSTKHLIGDVLRVEKIGTTSPKSFNNDIGVPLTIFAAPVDDDYLVLEIGTNHPGEILNLAHIARPDVAVITNCSAEHLEFLGDLDGVRRENASLIDGLAPDGLLIVNGDDPALLEAVGAWKGRRITFGVETHNDLFAADVRCDQGGVSFALNGKTPLRLSLLGRHNALNALAAIAVGREMGLRDESIQRGLGAARAPHMRLQLEERAHLTLINDAYNANPASMKAALDTLGGLSARGRRVAILGDMRELGPASAALHEEVGAFASGCGIDALICIGPHASLIGGVAKRLGMAADRVTVFASAMDAAAAIPSSLRDGDLVLLKGSRGMRLETIADAIKASRQEASPPCSTC